VKVLHVLPRNMRFTVQGATSIDLFTSEIVAASRYASTTTILAEAGAGPTLPGRVVRLPTTSDRGRWIASVAREERPDVVVVQQHAPTAVRLATAIAAPVVLQKHNFMPGVSGRGPLRWARRLIKARGLARLAGIAFVSEATLAAFRTDWPGLATPTAVIPNGASFAADYNPMRDLEILVVGRATPDKGLLLAAEAVRAVLGRHPEWRATFLVSEGDADPAYMAAIQAAAEAAGPRFELRRDVPHAVVQAHNARAAIAIVPSVWAEPFGRTALEAHAGGAALISSGAGGLPEISGPWAHYLETVSADSIERALDALIASPTLRAMLAEKGCERARMLFSIESISERLDRFLDEALERT
jgi:glycosyltransferase involved in cell wall biosynthesis